MLREAFHEFLSGVRLSLQKNVEMGRRAKRVTIPPYFPTCRNAHNDGRGELPRCNEYLSDV